MELMPFAPHPPRSPRLALASAFALLLGAVAPAALAETGGPLPQGYTTDGPAPPQTQGPMPPQVVVAPAPAQPVPVGPDADADPDQFADTDPSALTDFREPLAPYGQWTQDPTYGTLWVPDAAQVGADFAPYQTGGQWGVADGGDWAWQSDYAWGYIPFHYGRWVWAGNNWGWIPGRRYAPAWVTWRVGEGGYLGWAPLPPTWYWGGGRALGLRTTPYAAYCFVPTNYAFVRGVGAYVVRDRGMVQSIAAGTRPYRAATPTAGGYPSSPRFSEAHIPASASPRGRMVVDARATAFSTRSSTAAARGGYVRQGNLGTQGRPSTWGGSYSYVHPSRPQSQGLRTPGQGQAYPASPAFHSAAPPSYPSTHGSAGSFHPQAYPQAPHASAPQPAAPHPAAPAAASHVSRPSSHVSGGRRR